MRFYPSLSLLIAGSMNISIISLKVNFREMNNDARMDKFL